MDKHIDQKKAIVDIMHQGCDNDSFKELFLTWRYNITYVL